MLYHRAAASASRPPAPRSAIYSTDFEDSAADNSSNVSSSRRLQWVYELGLTRSPAVVAAVAGDADMQEKYFEIGSFYNNSLKYWHLGSVQAIGGK